MYDVIEFVAKMKDLASGTATKFAGVAQAAFRKVDTAITNTQRKFGGMGTSIGALSARMDNLTRKRDMAVNISDIRRANREIAALELRMNRLQTAGLPRQGGGGGLGRAGMFGIGLLMSAVTMGGAGIIKAGAAAQQDLIGLRTFVGNNANKVYAQIQQDAAQTPFGTKGLLSANRALISAGLGADAARKDVLGLANAIAATGGGNDELARMAANMQQIKNVGVATAADIKQFGIAGINIYQLLANATGKSIKQVKDMAVSYNLLAYSLRKAGEEGGVYAGAMEAQSRSITGKWGTLLDNLEIAAAKIGMSQDKAITGLIDKLIDLTNKLPELVSQWSGDIAKGAKTIIDFVGTLINMAKWVYRNWYWLKLVAGAALAFAGVLKIANVAIGAYNTIMSIAAMRATLLATATGEAAAGAGLLGAAFSAMTGPIGLVLAGVTAITAAIVALNKVEVKKKEIEKHNAVVEANEKYAKIARQTAQDLTYDSIEKMTPAAFFSRAQTQFHGTEVQDILETRLAGGDAKYRSKMMANIKAFYSELLNDPNTVGLVTLQHDPNNNSAAYAKRVNEILAFFDRFTEKYIAPPAKATTKADTGMQDGAADLGASTTGGGQKKIVITFRNMIENQTVNVNDGTKLVEDMEYNFGLMLNRLLAGVN